MTTKTVVSALADALTADAARPLVTWYDGATGERVELSVKTFANWVSKIANYLTDDVELDPGDAVAVSLPSHWQAPVSLVAVWMAGLAVSLDGSPVEPALSIVGPDARAHLDRYRSPVLACSLRPLGGPFLEPLPDGWHDFGREIPPQPDILLTPTAPSPTDTALHVLTGEVAHVGLVEQALETADELGLSAGGRLITDVNPSRASGLAAGIVAPIVVGASVVLTVNCDAATRSAIADQERVSTSFWLSG